MKSKIEKMKSKIEKMKSKIVLFSVLAVFALLAVSAVPSVSASDNDVYFVPEASYGQYCEDNTYVQIMVDTVNETTGGGLDIYFDPDCVNITTADFTGTPYDELKRFKHYGNYVRIGFMGPEEPIDPGIHLIANLTLHCVNETGCTSELAFTETELLDWDGDALPNVNWHDGRFSCIEGPPIPGIEVNKTVWNGTAWVKTINANISDTVMFNSTIHNNGTRCDLVNIVVMDTMSDSLEYAGVEGGTPEPDVIENQDGTTTLKWVIPGPLAPCNSLTFLIDANVTKCGLDWNKQNATAETTCSEPVYDEDYAYVNVPGKPDLVISEKSETIVGDELFNITYTVANIGCADAGPTNTTIEIDTWTPIEVLTPAIAKGENYTNTVGPYNCPCDENLTISVCADDDNVIDESNETNNCKVNIFECPPCRRGGIEVNKTVWDKGSGRWVDETTAQISEIVRFRCEMHNNGTFCPLINLTVTDTLSDSLEYADNVTIYYPNRTLREANEPIIDGKTYVWKFPDLVLEPCETLTIEFDARVIKLGRDRNKQNATAEACGEIVSAEDYAYVNVPVPPRPDVDAEKTVLDPVTGDWVEGIDANISDIVKFNCTTYNNGTCPLTNLKVTDTLSDSLEYADNVTIYYPNRTLREAMGPIRDGNIYVWKFPDVVLEPGDTITIEFDAQVIKCGLDWNKQNVTAEACGEFVYDEDNAYVNVPLRPDVDVDKTVLDPVTGEWVDSIDAKFGDIVNFNSTIHNTGTCCDLFNIVVMDTMSDSLEYAGVEGGTPEPEVIENPDGTTTLKWVIPGPLAPCNSLTFLIDAQVIKCGLDWNKQNATAETTCGGEVYDEDYAYVNVPGKPSIEVNKTVWDKESGRWVDETTAQISEIVRFRCEMYNNGTLCPLTNLVVTDTLSDSLEYADNVTIYLPARTIDPIEPLGDGGTYVWEFPTLVLEPGETITIEFDAHVIKSGRDRNKQNATAEGCGEIVSDEDDAYVNVPIIEKPDLTVAEITVNYDAPGLDGIAIGPEPGEDVHTECNNLSAMIEEVNGVNVVSPFDVSFEIDGDQKCSVRVPELTGGANKIVYCDCSWYPMAGDDFAINVTVDSNHEIPEANETNNTKWNNGVVVSNGYKGNGWQGPDMNLENVQCHDQDTINLTYSVGDSYYLSGAKQWTKYTANWTANDLPVPDFTDTAYASYVEKAILYVYYTWDKDNVMPDNVELEFNDNKIPLEKYYSDRKGFGGYDYPAGMLVYEVTDEFNAAGTNKAELRKSVATDEVSMKGMLLMVVYNHPDEPERIICIDEGFDMLYANENYAVTSEEATTYAPFEYCEPIQIEKIVDATLIAVAPNAADGDDKNRLSFNGGLWNGVWDHYEGATELGIAETNVLAHLQVSDNVANFQSHIPAGGTTGDFMEASNAFLILEKSAEPAEPAPAEPDADTGISPPQ